MNKSQLIDALAERIGDRRTAAAAVEGLLTTIVETVQSGETVSLTGFGVFESRSRAARVGRNPRTGETVAVPAATVPAFRPGTGFRVAVGGAPADGAASAPAPRTARRSRGAAAPAAPEVAAPTETTKPATRAGKSGEKEEMAQKTAKSSKGKSAKDEKASKPAKEKASATKKAATKTAAAKTAAKAAPPTKGKSDKKSKKK